MNIDPFTKNGYDLACGFRGPDYDEMGYTDNYSTVKWVLTARIRGIAGAAPAHGQVRVDPSLHCPQLPKRHTFEKFVAEIPNVTRHYLNHAVHAFRAIHTLTEDEVCKKEVLLLKRLTESAVNYHYNRQRGHDAGVSRRYSIMRSLWIELFEAEAADED